MGNTNRCGKRSRQIGATWWWFFVHSSRYPNREKDLRLILKGNVLHHCHSHTHNWPLVLCCLPALVQPCPLCYCHFTSFWWELIIDPVCSDCFWVWRRRKTLCPAQITWKTKLHSKTENRLQKVSFTDSCCFLTTLITFNFHWQKGHNESASRMIVFQHFIDRNVFSHFFQTFQYGDGLE